MASLANIGLAALPWTLVGSIMAQPRPAYIGDAPVAPRIEARFPRAQSSGPFRDAAPTWYDTSIRQAIADAFNNLIIGTEIPANTAAMGFTGNVAAGIAGTTSAAYQAAVFSRINFMRDMAGVPRISTLDPALSAKDQQAALMMSANNQLSHDPPTTWLFYTQAGHDAAANSNLCYGMRIDPGCVVLYMEDFGSDNAAAGHRRWLLYPQTTTMGTGDVPYSGNLFSANALWVIDSNYGGARPSTRDDFIAWPSKGYFPYQLLPARWSLSYPGASFTAAVVNMTRNGFPISLQVEAPTGNIGENTLVWYLSDNAPGNSYSQKVRPSVDITYDITVSNVIVGGITRDIGYRVIVFDTGTPDFNPASAHFTRVGGHGQVYLTMDPGNIIYSTSWLTNVAFTEDYGGFVFDVPPNPTGLARSGGITVNNTLVFPVTQDGGCSYSFNPASASIGAAGVVNATFTVTPAPSDCAVSASTTASWLTVSTSGNTVTYSAAADASSQARTGTITVGGQTFTVTQAGAACLYSLSPSAVAISPTGGNGSFVASPSPSDCAVFASSTAAWLTVSIAGSSVNFVATANGTGAQRSGTIAVGGQTFTVTQPANGAVFPGLVSLNPFQGSGLSTAFTLVYGDNNGWAAIKTAEAIVNPRWENPGSGCYIRFNTDTNLFTLYGNDGTSVAGSGAPGQTGALSNSQCSLNLAAASASGAGNNLTLTLPLTFTTAYATSGPCTSPGNCQKHVWMRATDFSSRTTNWLVYGVWNPNPVSVNAIPWYRFYNSLEYVYTFDKNEYDYWVSQGVRGDGTQGLVLNVPTTIAGTSNMAWYRMYVTATNSHFWTSDRNEYLTLINFQQDYVSEGVAAYVMPYLDDKGVFHDGVRGPGPVTNSVAFWRSAYNGKNLHFWSPVKTEIPTGFTQEGIACYIFPASGAQLSGGAALASAVAERPVADDGQPMVVSVRNAASHQEGPVAPGQALAIHGRHLGGRVLLNGEMAQTVSEAENEMQVIVPLKLAGEVELRVEVENHGRRSARMTAPMVRANPAIFVASPWGKGNAQAQNEDGAMNSAERPAARGSVVTLYATGGGLLDLPVEAHIAGYPARVLSTEVSGTRAGVIEVKVRIPEEVAPGPFQPVVLDFGNLSTQPGVGLMIN